MIYHDIMLYDNLQFEKDNREKLKFLCCLKVIANRKIQTICVKEKSSNEIDTEEFDSIFEYHSTILEANKCKADYLNEVIKDKRQNYLDNAQKNELLK